MLETRSWNWVWTITGYYTSTEINGYGLNLRLNIDLKLSVSTPEMIKHTQTIRLQSRQIVWVCLTVL